MRGRGIYFKELDEGGFLVELHRVSLDSPLMSLHPYGVLKGTVLARRRAHGGTNRHYQIEVKELIQHCRVSVNVISQEYPSELEVALIEPFRHPITAILAELPLGFTVAAKRPGGLALDYVRANPVRPEHFRVIPANQPGPDNDLNEHLDELTLRCANTPGARIYAFGEPWGPFPGQYDGVFHFTPEAGMHNVHMNQGNSPAFSKDDAVWQDGGLIFQFGQGEGEWAAVFLKFQSQGWHTDNSSGHRLLPPPGQDFTQGRRQTHAKSGQQAPVRISAAVINGLGQPEAEFITLRNMCGHQLNLEGWKLADWQKNLMPLERQVLAPGESRVIPLEPPFSLSNRGGLITLLDARGWKVDGVAYTRGDARAEGGLVEFGG